MAVSGVRDSYRRAHCEAHEKFERSCRDCDHARFRAMVVEHLPPEVFGPWKERAAREVPGWQAGMSPLLHDDDVPFWRLMRPGVHLSDADQDTVVAKAKRWDELGV